MELPRAGYAWTRAKSAQDLFKPGDVVEVAVGSVEDGVPGELTLEQQPLIEGAVVALDNRTGQIRVLIGGQSFARSKFNRATQARRQVGSLFKPIVYATSLDQGLTAASIFLDEPVSYVAGPNQPPYQPSNYDRKYEGLVTLRHALEQSRNIPAVKALEAAGPAAVVAQAKRLGLTGDYQPYLSLALGSAESTLLEMTSAYSAFAHQGVRMEPYAIRSVTDREGNLLYESRPRPNEALRADTSFLIAYLMRGVVERGTAQAARALDWPLAGKTGTMDDYTDAWFIGFDADVTVGVWVGYDEKRSLGYGETGASAALPIWMDVMRSYLSRRPDRANPPALEAPGNIVFVTMPNGQSEAFISGTQPAGSTPRMTRAPPPPAPCRRRAFGYRLQASRARAQTSEQSQSLQGLHHVVERHLRLDLRRQCRRGYRLPGALLDLGARLASRATHTVPNGVLHRLAHRVLESGGRGAGQPGTGRGRRCSCTPSVLRLRAGLEKVVCAWLGKTNRV